MRKSVTYSCILHAAIFAVAYYGLPELRRPAPMIDTPITVDIVTVADETNAPPPLPEPEAEPEAKPEPPPPPPEPEAQPTPPPEPEPAPPPPPEPAPPPEPEPEIAAVPAPEPKPEPKPKAKPTPEAKPEPPKPTPPEALARVTPTRKPKPPDDFASVLRTVEELRKRPPPKAEEQPEKKKEPDESFENQIAKALKAPARPYNPKQPLTISEIDLVRQQIARCWNLPAGAKDADDLVIEIHTVMNPTGTVREARIVDQGRMRNDPFFRAAAESALRAVLNPKCSPLKLPPEKYDQWKDMVLNFNPKEMF